MEIFQLIISGISQGCLYGLIALGFVLIYKATEMVNFAQGDLMMLGAYFAITFVTVLEWPFFWGVCWWLCFEWFQHAVWGITREALMYWSPNCVMSFGTRDALRFGGYGGDANENKAIQC